MITLNPRILKNVERKTTIKPRIIAILITAICQRASIRSNGKYVGLRNKQYYWTRIHL